MIMSKKSDEFAVIVCGEVSESDDYEEESEFETGSFNNDITIKKTVDLNCSSSKSNSKKGSSKFSTKLKDNGLSFNEYFSIFIFVL